MITVTALSHLWDLSRVCVLGKVLALCLLSSCSYVSLVSVTVVGSGVTASLGCVWRKVGAQ